MRLRILGCSGGIGGGNHTSAFLLDDSVLIDAGTGVSLLAFEELLHIEHVFLSHAHFDHIASLPTLLDTVNGRPGHTITVHASAATIADLREHIFNWRIWPDFSQIPTPENARLRFAPNLEITLETNPGTAEHGRFEGYRAAGVNRLSLGIQSFADRHLHALGRIHDGDEARRRQGARSIWGTTVCTAAAVPMPVRTTMARPIALRHNTTATIACGNVCWCAWRMCCCLRCACCAA